MKMDESNSKAEGESDCGPQNSSPNPKAECEKVVKSGDPNHVHVTKSVLPSEVVEKCSKPRGGDDQSEGSAEPIVVNGAATSPKETAEDSPKQAEKKPVKRKKKSENASVCKEGSSPPKRSKTQDQKETSLQPEVAKKTKSKKGKGGDSQSNGPLPKSKKRSTKLLNSEAKRQTLEQIEKAEPEVVNHVTEDLDKLSNSSLSPMAAIIPGMGEGRQRRTKSPKPGDFARKPRMKSPSKTSDQSATSDDDLPLSQLQSSLAASQVSDGGSSKEKVDAEPSEASVSDNVVNEKDNYEISKPPKKKKAAKKKSEESSAQDDKEGGVKKKKKPNKKVDNKSGEVPEDSVEPVEEVKPNKAKKNVKKKKVKDKIETALNEEKDEASKEGSSDDFSEKLCDGAPQNDDYSDQEQTAISASTDCSDKKPKLLKNSKISDKEGFEADVVSGHKLDSLSKLDSTPVKLLPAVLVNPLPHEENVRKSIDIYDMIDEDFDDLPMRPSGGHLEKGGTSPRALRLNSKENSEGGRCEKCGLILPTAAKLTKHMEHCEDSRDVPSEDAASETKPFKCSVCEYRCKWKFKLRRHQQIHGIYECSHCDLQAKSDAELDQHHKELHPNKPGKKICKTCKTYVVWGENFEEHVKNCQGKEPLKCPTCAKEFKSRSKLLAHEIIHTKPVKPRPQGAHQCHRCEYNTNDRYRLTRHLKTVHGEQLSCSTCGEEFSSYLLLMKHAKIHSKPITCETCGKIFKSMKNLHSHQLTHKNSSNSFKCTVEDCEKSYKSQKLLRDHFVEAHTNSKRWQCTFDGCKQEFFKQSHLKRHEATHTGERRYKCDWPNCGKAFRHADNLKVHYRQHTNEKPFKCEKCDFACRQKSSLQWHLKRYHQAGVENGPEKAEGGPKKATKTKKKTTKAAAKLKKGATAVEKDSETKPKKSKKAIKTKGKTKDGSGTKGKTKKGKTKKAAAAEKKSEEEEVENKEETNDPELEDEVQEQVSEPANVSQENEKEMESAIEPPVEEKDKSSSEENAEEPCETKDDADTEFNHDSKVLDSPVSDDDNEEGVAVPLRPAKSPTQEEYQSGNDDDSSPLPPVEADERPHAPRPPSPIDEEEHMPEEACQEPEPENQVPTEEELKLPDEHDEQDIVNSDDDDNELATTRSLADDDYIAPSAPAPPQPIEDPGITPPPQDIHEEPPVQETEYLPPPEQQVQPMPVPMKQEETPPTLEQNPDSVAHSVSSMMSPHMAPKSVPTPPPMYSTERQDISEKKDYSPHVNEQVPDRRDSYQSTDYQVNTPQSQPVENVPSQPPPPPSVEAHVYRDSAPSPSRSVAPMYSSSQDASGLPPPPTMSRDSGYSSSMMSTPGQYLQPPLPPASEYPRAMSCMPGLPNRSQDPSLFPPPPSGNFYSQFLPPDPSLPPVDDRYGAPASQRPPTTLPQDQQPSSFHMLGRPNTDLLRRATDIHKGYGSDFLQTGMHQPLPQTHWISQDDRTRHWTQPSTLPLPPDIPPNPALPKDPFLSVEREYEANRQMSKTTPTFPTDPMSHLDMASMYMSRHFNPAAAAAAAAASSQNYQRQLPSTTNAAKPYEDTYRPSHMPDYRTLSQTGGDMFRSMGMTAGFGLEKYYYPRDSMYRPQHLPSSSNPFMTQTAANQMAPYTDRDYARNAAMYHQPSPYSFMGDKQYLDSRKLTQPTMPGLTNRPLGAEYFPGAPPPPNATQDPHFQDPYRRSVIYNMMNRYFE